MPLRTRSRTPAPVSDSLRRLGDRIREARTDAGLSQAQLGTPHFTRAYVSALELGKIRPAMSSLEFIAGKLGKSASFFLEDEEQERKRRERDATLARAKTLIAEGSARQAVSELEALADSDLAPIERLSVKRTLGRAYVEAGEGARAAALLTDVVRGYEALGDPAEVARARGQLGSALITVMRYAEAEEHLGAALRATAAGTVRDPLFRVHVLHNLGLTLYYRDRFQAALEHFEMAEQEGADVADPKWLALLYSAMGMSRREVGDYEGAITSLRKSETLFESIHNRARVAEIRFQMARTLRAIGNKTRSTEVLAQAIAAAESAGNESLVIRIDSFRGLTEAEDGDYEGGLRRLEELVPRADATKHLGTRSATRFALAEVLATRDPARAESVLREMAEAFEGGSATGNLADIYDLLGKVVALQGRADEALSYAQRAYRTGRTVKKGGV